MARSTMLQSKFNSLLDLLLEIKSKEDLGNLLLGLFTPHEIKAFVIRLEIVKMLREGIPHHIIAKKLGIGVATVTRGSKEIKLGRFNVIK